MSRERAGVRATQLAVALALLLLWWLAATRWGVSPLLLPPPLPVGRAFVALIASGAFWPDLWVTLSELAAAFALAASAGSVVGYLVSRSRYSIRVFDPLFAALYAIPTILLFPLYVLFFGLGMGSKIALGATIAFFPVVLSTIAGLDYVDRAYITAARSMGASGRQMFWSVMLPAAFPVLVTGLRIGFILAFLSILGAETLAAFAGLGHRIVSLAEDLDTVKMFAWIALVVVIAFLLNAGVSVLEARARRGAA